MLAEAVFSPDALVGYNPQGISRLHLPLLDRLVW
jgi:hypothetical protein